MRCGCCCCLGYAPQAQPVQIQVQPPIAQPGLAYGIASAQQAYTQPPVIATGQPAGVPYANQPLSQQGHPAGQQTVVYGQPPTQLAVPSYGQPVYGQPQVQPAAITQLFPQQQTPVYMAPAAAAPQPTQYGISHPSQPLQIAAAYGLNLPPARAIGHCSQPLIGPSIFSDASK